MSTMTFRTGSIESAVNERFADIEAGYFEASTVPALITPAVVPAAVVATQASCFCAFC